MFTPAMITVLMFTCGIQPNTQQLTAEQKTCTNTIIKCVNDTINKERKVLYKERTLLQDEDLFRKCGHEFRQNK